MMKGIGLFNGKYLKALRKESNITQKALANELDVSFQAIGQYERGEASPKPETWAKIAKFFNVEPSALLDDVSKYFGLPTPVEDKSFDKIHAFQDFMCALGYQVEETQALGVITWETVGLDGKKFSFPDDLFRELMNDVARYTKYSYKERLTEYLQDLTD